MQNYLPDTIPTEDEMQPSTDISLVTHPSTWDFIRERLNSGGHVLDVGCGNGAFLWNVEHCTSSKAYGLDLSDTRTGMAAAIVGNGRIVKADGARAPFPPKSFDVIACFQVIEHIVDRPGFLAGLYTMLKPGGMLLITSVRRGKYRWYYLRNDDGEIVLDKGHVHEFSSLAEFSLLIESPDTCHSLSIVRAFEYRVRFSPLDFVLKRLHRRFRTRYTRTVAASRMGTALRKATRIPVPGYFSTDVVAMRRDG